MLNNKFIFQFPLIFIEERNTSITPGTWHRVNGWAANVLAPHPWLEGGKTQDYHQNPKVAWGVERGWQVGVGPCIPNQAGPPSTCFTWEGLVQPNALLFLCSFEPFLEPLCIGVTNCNIPCHPRKHPPLTMKPGPEEVGLHITEVHGWEQMLLLKGGTFLGSISSQSPLMPHGHFRINSLLGLLCYK